MPHLGSARRAERFSAARSRLRRMVIVENELPWVSCYCCQTSSLIVSILAELRTPAIIYGGVGRIQCRNADQVLPVSPIHRPALSPLASTLIIETRSHWPDAADFPRRIRNRTSRPISFTVAVNIFRIKTSGAAEKARRLQTSTPFGNGTFRNSVNCRSDHLHQCPQGNECDPRLSLTVDALR